MGNKYRKLIAAMLIACMFVALIGCGSGDSGESTAEENQDSNVEQVAEAAPKEAAPSISGKLQVTGTQLCDQNGNPVQLRGISTHGLAWFPDYVNEECVKELKSWGCNVFRLAMYSDEYGGYANGGDKAALRKLITDGVRYATDNDMYVIVDWHVLGDQDPTRHQDEAIKFFEEVTAEFSGQDNVIYEICNEPNSGTSWSTVKAYAEKVIPVIRKNAEDAIIIVGTPTWCQEVDAAASDPLTGDTAKNVMYALHFYAATHKDDLRTKMVNAINDGLPIFVSEYGICDASGNGAIDEAEAQAWVDLMDEYDVSYIMWNLSNKDETSAIIKPDCTKVSGFEDGDLSTTGKWFKNMLTDLK